MYMSLAWSIFCGTAIPLVLCLMSGHTGIPTLVILDENRKTITASGRASVSADPEGEVGYRHD